MMGNVIAYLVSQENFVRIALMATMTMDVTVSHVIVMKQAAQDNHVIRKMEHVLVILDIKD